MLEKYVSDEWIERTNGFSSSDIRKATRGGSGGCVPPVHARCFGVFSHCVPRTEHGAQIVVDAPYIFRMNKYVKLGSPSSLRFPCHTPENSFLYLHPQQSTAVPSENSKSPRREFFNPRIAEKMEVASIYLTQPVFSFLTGSQQFIMSPLGKPPNGNERGRHPRPCSSRWPR